MAVDEATKKQDELELYQIDDKAILPFFESHVDELRKVILVARTFPCWNT